MWRRLTPKEQRARRVLLGLILTSGRDPGLKSLASRLQVSESAAAKFLSALERKGVIVRDESSKTIMAAYPLSTRPTQHRVTLKATGGPRYALCAIDALGVGPAFDGGALVQSRCPQCRRPIRIRVEKNQIVAAQPASTVVWYALPKLLTKREPTVNLVESH